MNRANATACTWRLFSALMAKLILLIVILSVSVALSSGSVRLSAIQWNSFKQAHNKTYPSSTTELLRRGIFNRNKDFVEDFNSRRSELLGFRLSLNHLSDLSKSEMDRLNGIRIHNAKEYLLSNSPRAKEFLDKILSDTSIDIPDEVDWRNVPGRVTRVKNQGNCGSCWAFATTGVLEGQEVTRNRSSLMKNDLVELSEQNLIDCDRDMDAGCHGGFMTFALNFIARQGGIDSEESYPYQGFENNCQFKKDKVVMSDLSFAFLPRGDEQKLKEVVAKFGPVAVAVDVEISFQFYGGGILNDKNCGNLPNELNHGVLVVGYGSDPKLGDFWIVKNSWGSGWGEKGYIRMSRNRDNQCGIATVPVIPIF